MWGGGCEEESPSPACLEKPPTQPSGYLWGGFEQFSQAHCEHRWKNTAKPHERNDLDLTYWQVTSTAGFRRLCRGASAVPSGTKELKNSRLERPFPLQDLHLLLWKSAILFFSGFIRAGSLTTASHILIRVHPPISQGEEAKGFVRASHVPEVTGNEPDNYTPAAENLDLPILSPTFNSRVWFFVFSFSSLSFFWNNINFSLNRWKLQGADDCSSK